jgi:demethylmenaquinone methyltransferase/2-methoxy-6-polyprenyl-1,4-benzoquinol methylase
MVQIPDQYKSKEEYVHHIFASIAHRYDLLNTTLSFNRDKYWRTFAVSKSGLQPGGKGLDICCGTGMLTIEQARAAGPRGKVVGLDFCEEMLAVAVDNIKKTPYRDNIELVQGNAIDLPFGDSTFDCCTIGFALRNVPDIRKTISEMSRVVRPGGKVVNLELSKPSAPLFKQAYYLYFNRLVPLLGRLGIGKEGPYSYLPNSLKDFPHQSVIRDMFEEEGLKDARYYELTGGIVTVHVGTVA